MKTTKVIGKNTIASKTQRQLTDSSQRGSYGSTNNPTIIPIKICMTKLKRR
jgi:hypothetical protein